MRLIGEEIEDVIRDGGYRAWRFQRDMQGGRSWPPQLPARIEELDIFLYIATANAQLSETCQEEVQHAALIRKPFVTVVLHNDRIPPSPLDSHQTVYYDGTGKAVARLMRAFQSAEPLAWDKIPEDWTTWDGKTKSEQVHTTAAAQGIPSSIPVLNLTVIQKRDFLHNAIAESRACFVHSLREMVSSDSRIEFCIGHDSVSGFTCFISLDGQLITGCRIYISSGFNGISYDGNTYNALQWEIDDCKRTITDINRQINDNLQAVVDGDANAAEFVRSLDRRVERLRKQILDRETMINQTGSNTRFLDGDDSQNLRAIITQLHGAPALDFLPSPILILETPESRICTASEAAMRLWNVFIGDSSSFSSTL